MDLRPDFERADILLATVDLQPSDAVLDFGCGYGEVAAAVAPKVLHLVGVESDKDAVEYCRAQITAGGANATFESIKLPLPEIPTKSGTAVHLSAQEFATRYASHFDLIYSFNTFATFDEQQAAAALRLFSGLLKTSGLALLSCFLNAGFGPTDVDSDQVATLYPGSFPISLERLLALLRQEHFRPVNISLGQWRTRRASRSVAQSAPDLVLIERQSQIPHGFSPERYWKLHPDVAAANVDALEHYLLFGFYEGRQPS